jgi:hypothetical protein
MKVDALRALSSATITLGFCAWFGACGSSDGKNRARDVTSAGQGGDGAAGATAGAGASSAAGSLEGGEPALGSGGVAGAVDGGAAPVAQGGAEAGQGTADAGAGGATTGSRIFPTITALYDAIDAAELAEGEAWRVQWLADARVAEGSIAGVLDQGLPEPPVLDQGALPLKLFEAPDWVAGGLAGSLSFDSDGYPSISLATSAAGVAGSARLNFARYKFRRFTRARMRIAQDLSTASTSTGVQFELWDSDGQNRLSGNHFLSGGVGHGVALDYYHAGTQVLTGGIVTTTHAKVFEGFWNLTPASPNSATLNMTMRLDTLAGAALGSDSSAVVGHGDWSLDQGFDYVPYLGMFRTAGGSGTATATGVSLEITRYLP